MHNQSPHQIHEPAPEQARPSSNKSHEGIWSIVGTVLLLLAAPLIAVFITMFVFQSYEVDGPSMQHTLENRDRLIVYKLPITWSGIINKPYVPKRGEVVVFEQNGLSEEGNKQLIKRVIALPGERVVVKDGQMRVYNQQNPDGFNPDQDQTYATDISSTPGDVDLVVSDDEVFLVGDNRSNSLDSRYFGPVPTDNLVGELVFRLWPNAKGF